MICSPGGMHNLSVMSMYICICILGGPLVQPGNAGTTDCESYIYKPTGQALKKPQDGRKFGVNVFKPRHAWTLLSSLSFSLSCDLIEYNFRIRERERERNKALCDSWARHRVEKV